MLFHEEEIQWLDCVFIYEIIGNEWKLSEMNVIEWIENRIREISNVLMLFFKLFNLFMQNYK